MRIGIVCPYNYFLPGGVQEHVRSQALELLHRGHEVQIITPRPRAYKQRPPKHVIFLGQSARVRAPHATSADVSASVEQEEIEQLLTAYNFDIIHVHEPLVPFLARQILTKANCVRVGTFHAALPGNVLGKSFTGSYKTYARSVLPYIDEVTAVSPAAVGYIEEFNEKTVNYIPNGIDLYSFKQQSVERDKNMILFIGRLEKRKGAKALLHAYRLLKYRNPTAYLVIAGQGPQRYSLENYCQQNDIVDVKFVGFVDEPEKLRLMSRCGIYCSPALYGESFGIVLLEAMSMGAPIVAHANPGYEWVLKDTGRLSLVNVEDETEFARRMELMMQDDVLRQSWQKWAKQYVKQFSYKNIVSQYELLYENAIEKKKSQ